MDAFYTELPLAAQAGYAQLHEAALGAACVRSVADLNGSFNAKRVKGRTYWYFQCTQPSGVLTQTYVGPDSETIRHLIAGAKQLAPTAALEPLAQSAAALGCATVLPRHGRVLHRLAEYEFFRAGGLLTGTQAFLAYGNRFGVRWGSPPQTPDIDPAHAGRSIALALPGNLEVQTTDAVRSLERGFLPIAALGGKTGGSFLMPKEPEFRLDFLTTVGRNGPAPYRHPQLNVTLQPMPFMEFSLEDVEQAVVFAPQRPVLVNVPAPARFALYQLIVHGEREGSFRAEAAQDLAQAAHLLAYLWHNRTSAIRAAVTDLRARGPGWISRFDQGVAALTARYASLAAQRDLIAALAGRS